ncbi:hypothetical protein NY96_25970 [Xanthomonas citri pv. fuscans]|uniref:zincin-like metallopeptidase domain-containing protein n=1 Tax=Xanthomonas citri TaxID=346 RepID=UPI00062B94E2|nr:zincin-like metallopeptidase domain-containing protein [Xanthomonas citri]KKY03935.1 hypothetical protein NY96_25970 [Xanthomonas citri pv. fuscans]KKY06455.1 hypothetical protein NY68_22415 [Xanthomonas citri pv. fuscans]
MAEAKKAFHEQVAERLIEQLQAGTAPWQKPWQPGVPGSMLPLNPTTGKRYKGINAIQLMAQGYGDQRWMTYKQAAAEGAHVRRGEKGTPIQYWKFSDEQTRIDERTGKPVLDAKGEPVKDTVQLERPRVFFATVFNAEQIDGLPPMERGERAWNAVERAEHILAASGAQIRHGEQDRAFYRPATDSVHLPHKNQFPTADNYYATALHELGHWTGHPSRLDRDLAHPFGSEGYAKEELRAEIASMILGDELGIGHDPAQHVAYVGSWIKALQEDPLEIFRAAADAEKIQGYVLAFEQQQVQEQTTQQAIAPAEGVTMEQAQQARPENADHRPPAPVPEAWRGEACKAFDDEMAQRMGDPGYDRARRLSSTLRQFEEMSFEPSDREKKILEDRKTEIEEAKQWIKENVLLNPVIKERMYETVRDYGRDTGDSDRDKERHDYLAEMEAAQATVLAFQQQVQEETTQQAIAPVEPPGIEPADETLATALRIARNASELDGQDEIHRRMVMAASEEAFGPIVGGVRGALPADWNGQVLVQPSVVVGSYEGGDEEYAPAQQGQEPTIWPVFVQRQSGEYEWMQTCWSADEADLLANRLAVIDAYSTANEDEQEAKFARVDAQNSLPPDDPQQLREEANRRELHAIQRADPNLTVTAADAALGEQFRDLLRETSSRQDTVGQQAAVALDYFGDAYPHIGGDDHWQAIGFDIRTGTGTASPSNVLSATANALMLQALSGGARRNLLPDAPQVSEQAEKANGWMTPAEVEAQRERVRERLELAKAERKYLTVPFKEKDQVKALGAKWDRQERAWYVPGGVDPAPFAQWAQGATSAAVAAPASAPEAQLPPSHSQAAPQERKTDQGRIYLAVPYGEHVAAKAAGAQWDKVAKSWYAGPQADMGKLQRWVPDNVPAQQSPAMTPEQEFGEALQSLGCVISGKHPIMDGQKHRIEVAGDRSGAKSGFYVGHLDGHPAGYIMNNRTGVDMKWKSKGYTLDPEEKARLQAEAATKLAARAAEQDRLQEATAKRVGRQAESLVPVSEPTPYMQAKQIQVHAGVLTDNEGQKTYIPAFDADGKQWTMQYIQEDGTKRFAKDSRKEGCFHPVGGMDALVAAPAIVIAEGYATAATVAEALGHATVAAFDSGNLPAVAQALHAKFPDKPIVIAGDDDRQAELTQGINPGRKKALEAAKAVGGKAIFPIFAPGENSYPAELPPITPEAWRAHEAARLALSAAGDNKLPKPMDELKRDLLSDEQLEALSRMKLRTDFNDVATRSTLGAEGVDRQVCSAVGKVLIEEGQRQKREQLTMQQEPEQHRQRRARVQ